MSREDRGRKKPGHLSSLSILLCVQVGQMSLSFAVVSSGQVTMVPASMSAFHLGLPFVLLVVKVTSRGY
jgi:hypothetical protein